MTNTNEVTPSDAGMEYTPLKIKPDPTCRACLGTGEVNDSVPYGMGSVSMPSICDCVLEQVPEGEGDREVEIDLSGYREPKGLPEENIQKWKDKWGGRARRD